jgi:hypothetical protein
MNGEAKKLGIAVVCLVIERNEKLLDLHLRQIEKYTDVPYTICGSANKLLPQFRAKLEKNPKGKICKCEHFDVSSWTTRDDISFKCRDEHTFYVEQLIKYAIDDGVSHVAILHVDSFPIQRGWATQLAAKLSSECVLEEILKDEQNDRNPLSDCMLFHRDFYTKYHPILLLSEDVVHTLWS